MLLLDYQPAQYKLDPRLARLLGIHTQTRPVIINALWQYIKVTRVKWTNQKWKPVNFLTHLQDVVFKLDVEVGESCIQLLGLCAQTVLPRGTCKRYPPGCQSDSNRVKSACRFQNRYCYIFLDSQLARSKRKRVHQ